MKKLILISTAFLLVLNLFAQVPDYFHYQAVLRNLNGTPMSNEDVSMQIDLLSGAIDGPSIYLENQATTTDERGMVILKIGDETLFNEIDWENGPYFLSVNVNGTHLGTSQLLSVPYALYAKRAGSVHDDDSDPTNELQTLSIDQKNLTISGGNTITLPDMTTPWLNSDLNGIYYTQNVGIGITARNPEMPLDIQRNVAGTQQRSLIRLRNLDEGINGYVSLALEAYSDKTEKTFYRSEFLLTSEEYLEIPDFRGMTAIRAPGNGFSVLSESETGSIRFYTTNVQDTIMERARIDPAGFLGIGTSAPEAKLHVKEGDIMVEDATRGVILESPNGQRWRITVNDDGLLGTTLVSKK